MNLRKAIFWQPGGGTRWAIILAGIVLALLIDLLHTMTGLRYEFHVFFSLPVLLVAWYVGAGAGYGVACLTVLLWFIADRMLMGVAADSLPLLLNTAARIVMSLGTVWLLTNLRRLVNRETQLAREDSLTGLKNRHAFLELGWHALAQAERQRAPFTAALIDLDRFKAVNDVLGHQTGDAVLRRVADEMLRHVRIGDVVGRLGGDEFALLMPGMNGTAAAPYVEALRQRLLAAMREGNWPVTFSIGVASYQTAPVDLDALLAKADGLMYEVKNGGRDRVLLRTFVATEAERT